MAWTVVARAPAGQAARTAAAARSGHALASAQVRASMYHNALAAGVTRGFLAAAGIALAALIITVITIRVRRGPSRREPGGHDAVGRG